jgi:hypothetical protein
VRQGIPGCLENKSLLVMAGFIFDPEWVTRKDFTVVTSGSAQFSGNGFSSGPGSGILNQTISLPTTVFPQAGGVAHVVEHLLASAKP